jgi:hypothetical protein
MIFGQDRNTLRKMYADAWQKHCDNAPLSPLEAQIAQVVEEHPEYHDALGSDLAKDFTVEGRETNPYLHMGLHLSVREQVATDRPSGIAATFQSLAHKVGDNHMAEHRMIDCLAETLWESQRDQSPPDELQYLERLRQL